MLRNFSDVYAWFRPRAIIKFVEKSFITAKDTEVDSRYGKWFNPPVKANEES